MKKQSKKQPKQIKFWFVLVRTEKKINCFEDPLIEIVFWRFFGLFRRSSVCFGCFDTGQKYRNKQKKILGVLLNRLRNNRNRLSFGLFLFELKKIDCFEDTLHINDVAGI